MSKPYDVIMSKLIFSNKNNEFYQSLKDSVEQYFINNKKEKTGDARLFIKSAVLIFSAIGMYIVTGKQIGRAHV